MLKPDMLISQNEVKSTIKRLKDEEGYNLLLDITAIDYLKYPDITPSRFGLIYILRDKTFKNKLL